MCTVCTYRRILCKEVNALNKVFEAIASWWEWMVSIAMNFQFKDAVDIIIVAFLIYGVVKLVRETRAGQLVKGLFLLVILFIISSYFNLVMVSRVLAYFFRRNPHRVSAGNPQGARASGPQQRRTIYCGCGNRP